MAPRLYMLGVPITSDFKDLSPSAIQKIQESDFVIGEERKTILRFLAAAECREKYFTIINEHSTDVEKQEVLGKILNSKSAVLFSDAGTPAVADPGYDFVDMCHDKGVDVHTVPGPSSIVAALSASGFYSESFYFAGFPPREDQARKDFFKKISDTRDTVVLLERPYALHKTVEDFSNMDRRIVVAVNLGFDDEVIYRGTPTEVLEQLPNKMKKPFVIVIERRVKIRPLQTRQHPQKVKTRPNRQKFSPR